MPRTPTRSMQSSGFAFVRAHDERVLAHWTRRKSRLPRPAAASSDSLSAAASGIWLRTQPRAYGRGGNPGFLARPARRRSRQLFGSEVIHPRANEPRAGSCHESRLSSTRRGPRPARPPAPSRGHLFARRVVPSRRRDPVPPDRGSAFLPVCRRRAQSRRWPLFARTRPAEGPASLCWPPSVVPAGPPFLTAFTSEVT
jgi:hypothetical protein